MSDKASFTAEEARAAGEQIGIHWVTSLDVEQFRMGMDVERPQEREEEIGRDVRTATRLVRAAGGQAHLSGASGRRRR